MNVSVHGAKTQLSKLLDLVEDGEEVVIERHGHPVAQLVRVRKRRATVLGAMRGQFQMVDGWERPLTDEEADAFWSARYTRASARHQHAAVGARIAGGR
jgi:prevent-host-death family protein